MSAMKDLYLERLAAAQAAEDRRAETEREKQPASEPAARSHRRRANPNQQSLFGIGGTQ